MLLLTSRGRPLERARSSLAGHPGCQPALLRLASKGSSTVDPQAIDHWSHDKGIDDGCSQHFAQATVISRHHLVHDGPRSDNMVGATRTQLQAAVQCTTINKCGPSAGQAGCQNNSPQGIRLLGPRFIERQNPCPAWQHSPCWAVPGPGGGRQVQCLHHFGARWHLRRSGCNARWQQSQLMWTGSTCTSCQHCWMSGCFSVAGKQ